MAFDNSNNKLEQQRSGRRKRALLSDSVISRTVLELAALGELPYVAHVRQVASYRCALLKAHD
jgi:hypothetical protein